MTKESTSRKTWGDTVKIFDYSDREAWLKGRMKGIGGSDAAAVIGQNPYKSNTELFYEKTAQKNAEDISGKDCVIYGTKAEEPIRELFKLDYPEYIVEHHPYRIYQSEEHPFMQASLDGELQDHDGRRGILEIKTSEIMQASQWAKWKDQIPPNYYVQVLHYLIVTGYQFAVVTAHLRTTWQQDRKTEVRHYFIERSEVEDDLKLLTAEEVKFWQYVTEGKKPPLMLPEI